MRREDLTTEELRLERLLQTLARDPAAPDPEFLKLLREASTKAFLDAQASHPQPRRVQRATPPDPAISRRLLRTVRIAMMSAVAMLLVMGLLPPSILPSRGVALQVAIDNLRRNDSVEIEVQNGTLANNLYYSHDNGLERVTFKYPSGKMQVTEGGNSVFFNSVSNSVHPAPELAEVNLDVLKDKLLTSLNVNDPQVQSIVLSQRPKTLLEENGSWYFNYQIKTPAAANNGETLIVDATVDARTNALVAMNSKVTDAFGNVQFQANADVKGVNIPGALDDNTVSSLAREDLQIARIEEIHGNAKVYDFSLPQNTGEATSLYAGTSPQGNFAEGENQVGLTRQFGGFGGMQNGGLGGLGGGMMQRSIPQKAQGYGAAVATAEAQQVESVAKDEQQTQFDASQANQVAADNNTSRRGDARFSKSMSNMGGARAAPPREALKEEVSQQTKAAPEAPAQAAAPRGKANADPAPAAAADTPAPAPVVAQDVQSKSAPKTMAASSKAGAQRQAQEDKATLAEQPPAAPAPAPAANTTAPNATAPSAIAPNAAPADDLAKQQLRPLRGYAQNSLAVKKGASQQTELKDLTQQQMLPQATFNDNANSPQVSSFQRQRRLPQGESWERWAVNSQGTQIPQVELTPQTLDRLHIGFNERPAEERAELKPGELLKTDPDSSNIVRLKLANDANVLIGPGSEVQLLKPTEVRLRFGEVVVEVPPKDQVDLLGPEPEYAQEQTDNYKGNRRSYLQKGSTLRRQVVGRGMFRIENNQLQEVQQQPRWLVRYYASDRLDVAAEKAESAGAKAAEATAGAAKPAPAKDQTKQGGSEAKEPVMKARAAPPSKKL